MIETQIFTKCRTSVELLSNHEKMKLSCQKKNPYQVRLDKGLWRNGRDSNPRAAHHGNTISSFMDIKSL